MAMDTMWFDIRVKVEQKRLQANLSSVIENKLKEIDGLTVNEIEDVTEDIMID